MRGRTNPACDEDRETNKRCDGSITPVRWSESRLLSVLMAMSVKARQDRVQTSLVESCPRRSMVVTLLGDMINDSLCRPARVAMQAGSSAEVWMQARLQRICLARREVESEQQKKRS